MLLFAKIYTDNVKLFLSAVGTILKDDGFKLPSPEASDAAGAASSMLDWSKCAANKPLLCDFSRRLVKYLRTCLLPDAQQVNREGMWFNFSYPSNIQRLFYPVE